MSHQLLNIEHQLDYQSMNLPIHSKELVEKCMNRCHVLHLEWCKASDLNNLEIVHRHIKEIVPLLLMNAIELNE